jgi:hypothetical protein
MTAGIARVAELLEQLPDLPGALCASPDVDPEMFFSADPAVIGAARLASRFPGRWEGVTADSISAERRARDVPSVDVKADGVVRKGCRRGDVEPLAGAR